MPKVGDREIGTNIGNHSWGHYIYAQCSDCGYTRWVALKTCKNSNGRCNTCAKAARKGISLLATRGANNPAWKGGRLLLKSGYIRVSVYPEDQYFEMGKSNKGHVVRTILEHRLVMARHLERCLERWEIVHHKNGDRADNRLENLELLPNQSEHQSSIQLQQEVNKLRKRVGYLEERVIQLEAQSILDQGVRDATL